jgi:Tol biopolymer transport system component
MDADGTNIRAITADDAPGSSHWNPDWSADGRWVAYDTSAQLYVLDTSRGTTRLLADEGVFNSEAVHVPGMLRVSPVGRTSVVWEWLKTLSPIGRQ